MMAIVDVLARLPIFKDVPRDVLSRLVEHTRRQSFERNEVILHQHDDAHDIYFLLSGSVQFLISFQGADNMLVGTTRDFGAPIGWSVAREPHRYTATVRCEEPCEVIHLPRSSLEQIIEQYPEAGYDILCRLAAAVATRLEQARDLLVIPARQAVVGRR
jgi:CRP-like cAMP-binding protein